MKKIRPASEVFWDVVPEIDQHDVRYSGNIILKECFYLY